MDNNNCIWKKYSKTMRKNNAGLPVSYESIKELYEDTKNNKKWWKCLFDDLEKCETELCGEQFPAEGIRAGDIYVYYIAKGKKITPEFYLKVKRLAVEFNGNDNIITSEINVDYYPLIANKLKEVLNEELANKYVPEINQLYTNIKKLDKLCNKDDFTEYELIFLYYMAYQGFDKAKKITGVRDYQQDYNNFSFENKILMFKYLSKEKGACEKLIITSKDELLELSKRGYYKLFKSASEGLINDKDFMLELLDNLLEKCLFDFDRIMNNIPSKYLNDDDIIGYMFFKNPNNIIFLDSWLGGFNYQENKKILEDEKFVYGLIDKYCRALLKHGWEYDKTYFLDYSIPSEYLENLESHILIGPEESFDKEEDKKRIIEDMESKRESILSRRKEKRK